MGGEGWGVYFLKRKEKKRRRKNIYADVSPVEGTHV